jgi:hypothetical protein
MAGFAGQPVASSRLFAQPALLVLPPVPVPT